MSQGKSVDLTQGSIPRHILRMLGPFWLAIIAMMSAGVVDTIYLGRLSTEALAAVGFCFPTVLLGNSVNIGLGAGTLSAISRDLGKKRYAQARSHGASAILLSISLMMILSILGFISMEWNLKFMGAAPDILPLSVDYLTFALPALIFMGIGMMCNNTLRAGGEAILPSSIMISGAVLNIIIDPLLIFGIGPFPRLEVTGAALGTLISSMVTAGYGLFLVLFYRKVISFIDLTHARLVSAWEIIGRVGVPAMFSNALVPISAFIVTMIIARTLGTMEVAVFTLVGRVEILAVSLLYALSACIGANTGQNGGADLTDRVRQAFRFSYQICLAWGLFIAILLAVFAHQVPTIFSKDPDVITRSVPFFWIVPITFAGYGMVFVSAAGLNGLGRPSYGLYYTILRSIVFYILFIWIGARVYGMTGVYYGIAAANIFSGLIACFYTTLRVPMTVRR